MNEQPTPNQQPTPEQQQSSVPQPSPSATQVVGQPSIQSPKQSKTQVIVATISGIAALGAFVGQLSSGTFFLASVILGVWPLYVGLRLKITYLTILGALGIGLNLIGFIAAFFL